MNRYLLMPIQDLDLDQYRQYLDIMVDIILTMREHEVIIVY